MSNYRRADIKSGTYFFTVVTYRRRQILGNENVRNALREGIKNIQTPNPFTIDASVLLPDHLHCIWTLPPNDANLGIRWAMIVIEEYEIYFAQRKCIYFYDQLLSGDSE